MAKLSWKRIEDEWHDHAKPQGYTYRAEVPGGWLVSVWSGDAKHHAHGGGITFLPDPDKSWQVNELGE
jgi:hypothetical protein